jgi:hypothetical protein
VLNVVAQPAQVAAMAPAGPHVGFYDYTIHEDSQVPVDIHRTQKVLNLTAAKSMLHIEVGHVSTSKENIEPMLALDEPAVLQSFAAMPLLPTRPSKTSLDEIDNQPNALEPDCYFKEPAFSVSAIHAEDAAASASKTADAALRKIQELEKYLEERRAAVESQRYVAESTRAHVVHAAFPRTPRCVNLEKHARRRGRLLKVC